MGLEYLSQKGFVHEFVEVSNGPHPSRFCFVLGAGASKSSGIKMGQELVDIWEKELIERNEQDYIVWRDELGITDENKYNFYSQYYEKRFQKRPVDGLNFLEKMMEYVNPNVGYVVLAYLLTKTVHNVVITTNFDHLTEDAVNYYAHVLPLIIGHESLSHYISKQITRPTIVKIHRDLLFDPKNTAKEVETLHDAWKESLEKIFSEYHPVFIGYAGNDNSLMNYLIEHKERFKTGVWKFPYWTLYKSEIPNKKVQEFLNGAGGYCINCNGFDELLCGLGEKLGYEVPTEEKFISDAKNRYSKLKEAFENIIDNETTGSLNGMSDSDNKLNLQVRTSEQPMSKITDQILFMNRELVQEEPENARYHYGLGVSLHAQGKYEEAAEEKKKAVELEPENARYHNSLEVTLYMQDKYEEAEVESRKAVELEPENAIYHDNLGMTLHAQEKYEEAEKEKKKAVELEPENARYYNSLGLTLNAQRKYEEAEKEKKKAVELEPENARYHNSLGVTLHRQGKYEESEKEKKKAVELEPENARYHNSFGITLHEQGRYGEAEKEIRKAIELEPENASYHDRLGMTLREQGKYAEAEKEFRKAIELDPLDAYYHNDLGATLYAQGKYEEAEKEARKATELEPENASYHDSLGMTLHEQGKYEEAEKEKRQAVELGL